MGVLLGTIAGVLLGISDFCAARASRTAHSLSITRTALLVSGVLAFGLTFVVKSRWQTVDMAKGAASGLAMMTGLALLYRGYSVAKMGIVAPSASVVLNAVPVLWDLLQGRAPSAIGVAGIVLGVIGVAIATYDPHGTGSSRAGLALGAGSGVFFGVGFTVMSETSKAAGLTPVFMQRSTGFVVLSIVALFQNVPLLASKPPARRWGVATGLSAGLAIASLQLGFRRASAGPVSVAASQFATVAVLLAFFFNKEKLRTIQWCGIALAAIGVGLLAQA
jgi:drug/metabolite transporter (DMT)-like permease